MNDISNDLLKKYDFKGKTAVVTGAGSGIGKRISMVLSAFGALVCLVDINEEGTQSVAGLIQSELGIDVDCITMDVTDPESVTSGFSKINSTRGGCDILVCSAGISSSSWIEEMTLESWQKVIDVNLTGTFLCCQAAVRSMMARHWGRIINIASIASRYAPWPREFDGAYNYSASKAGVVAMSRRLAVELAGFQVTVNCISPGLLITPLTERKVTEPNLHQKIIDHVPMHRLGTPEDLDGLVMYLCSDLSGYVTGQELFVDGGYSLW